MERAPAERPGPSAYRELAPSLRPGARLPPEPAEAGKELLAELSQAGADDAEPVLGALRPEYGGRVRFLGLLFALLLDLSPGPDTGRAPTRE